jgi:hypothetical protein
MDQQMTPPSVEEEERGDLWRLQGIIFEPGKTFESINRRPSFWLALIATIVLAVLFWQILPYFVDLEELFLEQARQNPQTAQLSDEELEGSIGVSIMFVQWGAAVVAPVVFLFLIAALIMLLVHLTGSETSYKKLLGVTSHTLFFQSLVGMVLTLLVYSLASDPKSIDIENPLYTNLGHLVSAKESPVIYKLASSVDIVVWYVIYLLGLGTATVSAKMKVAKGVILVATLYGIYVLLGVGWAALMA